MLLRLISCDTGKITQRTNTGASSVWNRAYHESAIAHKIAKGNGIGRNPLCYGHTTTRAREVFSKPAALWIALTVSRYYSS